MRGSLLTIVIACVVACLPAFGAPAYSGEPLQYDLKIDSQPLGKALQEFAKQSGVQVIFFSRVTEGHEAPALKGKYTAAAALQYLLNDSQLTFRELNPRTIEVHPKEAVNLLETAGAHAGALSAADALGAPASGHSADSTKIRLARADENATEKTSTEASVAEKAAVTRNKTDERIELGEMVVTGSNIRGVRPASPVVTITQEEMRLSGHNNLGEAIRALPQNFNGGQNPGVAAGAGVGVGQASNRNLTGGSGLNLRGLGPDATLTLLNGIRLPYDGLHQATDVASIPTAAVERFEILLDGASAIYGSDAVAGVANIVLKRDYNGAELSARYGAATDGGYQQTQLTGVGGHTWDTGGFLLSGDYSKNTRVLARQRDYLAHMLNQSVSVYPSITQESALFSGHQQLGDVVELSLDGFYTERSRGVEDGQTAATFTFTEESDSVIWGVAPALRFAFPGEWSLRLQGAAGRNEAELRQVLFLAQTREDRFGYFNRAESAGLDGEGPLFTLPAGAARLSVGGGYRKNDFDLVLLASGVKSATGVSRSRYGYAEVNLPLVSQEQHIPLVTRFSVNGALRYENYESFGDTTTPKFGVIWGLVRGFDIKASWGRSFKAPTLNQLYQARQLFLQSGSTYSAPAGTAVMLVFGGNPDLEPEGAETLTAGFLVRPESWPEFNLEVNWFDIDFIDRVVAPLTPLTQALISPAFAEFVTLNPTLAEQEAAFAQVGLPTGTFTSNSSGAPYDPATVHAVMQGGLANAHAQRVSGFDLLARYTTDLFGGSLSASGNASWITDATRKLNSLAPELQVAGVIYFPPKFRGSIGASWTRSGFTLSSIVNHIGGVDDVDVASNPKRDSMTTLDLVIDYRMDTGRHGDFGVNVAVTNVFNETPPFKQPVNNFRVNYDSTNYSALGRIISATVTKRF